MSERAGPAPAPVLECVVNLSEGRAHLALGPLARACGPALLDRHADPVHHRAVFTLAGEPEVVEDAVRRLARAVVDTLHLDRHDGVHPRFGVLDVVPFVALRRSGSRLTPGPLEEACQARDRFAEWAGEELGLPCFLYGPQRTLPEVRRRAFDSLAPDRGPASPHPSAGACAVGARGVLVAFNVWLRGVDPSSTREIARSIRGPAVRALGFEMTEGTQVSCNLLDPWQVGPGTVLDQVHEALRDRAGTVARCELVGLLPAGVLDQIEPDRWEELDLSAERTIEARLGVISRR